MEGFFPTNFRVDSRKIADIVAAEAAWAGFKNGGSINVTDAKIAKIGDQRLGIHKLEVLRELQPIRGTYPSTVGHADVFPAIKVKLLLARITAPDCLKVSLPALDCQIT